MEKVSNPRLFDMPAEEYKAIVREKFQEVKATPTRSKAMEYYYANRERILEQQRASRKRAKLNAKQREYYAKNREKVLAMQKRSRDKRNREARLSKSFFGRLYLKIFG